MTSFQPFYRFKELAPLFSTKLEMLQHISYRNLSVPAPLKLTSQIVYGKAFHSSTLPRGVSKENSDGSNPLLSPNPRSPNQTFHPNITSVFFGLFRLCCFPSTASINDISGDVGIKMFDKQ